MKKRAIQEVGRKIAELQVSIIDDLVARRDVEAMKRFLANSIYNGKLISSAREDFSSMVSIMRRLAKSGDLNAREFTLIIVLSYLLAAEGIICNCLNFISYLLATRNHDLFSLIKRKYVEDDIEEIRKVEMWIKIQFLNFHGFEGLTREYDSTFRNDIAHRNYTIDDQGILWIREKPVDLGSKIDSMQKVADIINDYLDKTNESMQETLKKLKIDLPKKEESRA